MSLQSLIDKPKELLELIDSCLKPKQEEKKKFGEVFTPMKLINEMLDKLDEYYKKEHEKSIFENKNFKWFDPANGMGNFPMAVYLRLMEGLKKEILDEKNRKQYILEKMLYMSELNKKNVFICRQIFDINNEYKLNLYNGDSLKLNTEKEWGFKKFNVIMGNPPYNKGGIHSHTGKHLGEKNETIWPAFIEKSINSLNKNGFLVFINPLSWLKKSHSMHDKLLEKHVIWLKLWDNSQSKINIDADIPLSLYIVNNIINKNKKKTEVISILKRRHLESHSMVYLNENKSIPLAYHSIFDKISKKIDENINLKLEVFTKTVKCEKSQIKLSSKMKRENNYGIDTYRMKDGYFVKHMLQEHPHHKENKLILANKASLKGGLIDNGTFGLVGSDKFYILGDELEILKEFLESQLCEILSHLTKYRQDFLEKDAFNYIPDIRYICEKKYDKEKIYEYFKFTEEEIKNINKF